MISQSNNTVIKKHIKGLSKLNIDFWLFLGISTTIIFGLLVLYSASNQNGVIVEKQIFRILLAFVLMIGVAQVNPVYIKIWTPRVFLISFILLLAVPIFGDVSLGAKRWLDIGILRFQPSEIFKILLPLMLAWMANEYGSPNNFKRLTISLVFLIVPVALIMQQPDLGTSILVFTASFAVIFLAGINWKVIFGGFLSLLITSPFLWYALHDYQRLRIKTLFNPEIDPSGAGFHIIQSKIAIGSGGLFGQGWLNGTQSHLNFIPEQKTDFIFSVLSEEFGLIGFLFLIICYLFIIMRLSYMTLKLNETFEKLVSGAIVVMFISYITVNIGMVTGLLPVVGVPLPLISYGGTSMATMLIGFGMICSFYKRRTKR